MLAIGQQDLLVGAQYALPFQHQADELSVAMLLLVEQWLATDEIPVVEDQGPPHVGFPGGDAFIHVVAVQVHAGFQTQGIAGAQADGGHAGVQQLFP